jgi:glycosyltransferase involved in cell wall biosynthesis
MSTDNDRLPARTKLGYLQYAFPAVSETFVLNEMEALSKLGMDIWFFALSPRRGLPLHKLAQKWSRRALYSPPLHAPKLWPAHAYWAFSRHRQYLDTVVHNHSYGGKKHWIRTPYLALAARRKGIRHVHAHFGVSAAPTMQLSHLAGISYSLTLHSHGIFCEPPDNMAELINRSKFSITISDYNRVYLLEHWPQIDEEKLKVVHCGIDTCKFSPPPNRAPQEGPWNLLSVARMVPQKNLEFAIALCQRLAERGIDFCYTIVGEGPGRPELERLVREAQLEERVVLAGAVSQEDLVSVYRTSDVFVLTSKTEGIPVSAMEAMACGLCVVAPRITGLPELVEHGQTGLLYRAGEIREAVQALTSLMGDPERRTRMGRWGREKVIQSFGMDANAKRFAALVQGHGGAL